MKIKVREVREASVLDVNGNINIDSAEIIEVIGGLLKYNRLNILLNFKNVTGVDYNGLSVLVIAYKNITNHKGKLRFCNVPVYALTLLKTAHLDTIFEIYDNEKAALRSFKELASRVRNKVLRRRFKRLDMHINVSYNLPARPKQPHKGRLLNISGAGIYIRCKNIYPMKTRVNLKIDLPDFTKPIEVQGMVIWNADREIQPHEYPGMGFQFIDISSGVQKDILEFIDKNISHRSGRGLYTE